MTRAPRIDHPEELVEAWQGPLYRLALRMLGDDAAARDATQEVFVRLLETWDHYDPRRPLRPWIYRIARNVVLNRIRAEKTRRGHEERAARERPVAGGDDRAERRERDARVLRHVRRLPPAERLPVVLHFYEGLSQVEVARVLETARTTVRSRLERALASLRGSLEGAGHLSLVPAVEAVMRSSPAPAVPAPLSASLSTLAAQAGTVAVPSSTAGLVLGGLIVTKKTAATFAVTFALALGAGYLVGQQAPSRAPERRTGPRAADAALRAEIEDLRDANADLRARLDALRPDRDATVSTAGDAAGGGDAAPAPEPAPEPVPDLGIWSSFAESFADHYELIGRLREADPEQVDPADQQRAMAVYMEYMGAASKALAMSDRPFFDERILPGFVDAVYGPSLELDAAARNGLRAAVREALARHPAAPDALTSERWRARLAVIDAVHERLREIVPEDRRERLATVHGIGTEMLRGSREVRVLDLGSGEPLAERAGAVVRGWDEAIGLTEAQERTARETAAAFVRGARDVLARRNLDRPGLDPDSDEFAAADREILELQIEAEQALQPHLTGEQQRAARKDRPRLFRFRVGTGDTTTVTAGGGL